PPRDRADPPDPDPGADLPATGAITPPADAPCSAARVPPDRGGGDTVAQRDPRAGGGRSRVAARVPAPALLARGGAAAGRARDPGRLRSLPSQTFLRRRHPLAAPDGRQVDLGALRRLRLHPAGTAPASVLRARIQRLLGLLRVRDRQDQLGAALVLRGAARRGRARRDGALPRLSLVPVQTARRGAEARAEARGGRRPGGGASPAARLGHDRRPRRDDGRERLLPDDGVPLLLRLRDAR